MVTNRCTHDHPLVLVVDEMGRQIAVRECQAWRWAE